MKCDELVSAPGSRSVTCPGLVEQARDAGVVEQHAERCRRRVGVEELQPRGGELPTAEVDLVSGGGVRPQALREVQPAERGDRVRISSRRSPGSAARPRRRPRHTASHGGGGRGAGDGAGSRVPRAWRGPGRRAAATTTDEVGLEGATELGAAHASAPSWRFAWRRRLARAAAAWDFTVPGAAAEHGRDLPLGEVLVVAQHDDRALPDRAAAGSPGHSEPWATTRCSGESTLVTVGLTALVRPLPAPPPVATAGDDLVDDHAADVRLGVVGGRDPSATTRRPGRRPTARRPRPPPRHRRGPAPCGTGAARSR